MAIETRIYIVRNKKTGAQRLIDAAHPANAIRYVANEEYEASVAKSTELVRALESGAKVERVKSEQTELSV